MEIDVLINIINEEIENINLEPNKARSSGFSSDLIYLSISKSYAIAYAHGQTSAAHAYRSPIVSGVLFYVCLDENHRHYGGDVWVSGYKNDIIDDLNNYVNNWNNVDEYSTVQLDTTTTEFIMNCGLDKNPTPEEINNLFEYLKNDDLSVISPLDWSIMQEEGMGYSEICLKEIPKDIIIKVEVYKNSELIKTIMGNYIGDCDVIFYHGSPLKYWSNLT